TRGGKRGRGGGDLSSRGAQRLNARPRSSVRDAENVEIGQNSEPAESMLTSTGNGEGSGLPSTNTSTPSSTVVADNGIAPNGEIVVTASAPAVPIQVPAPSEAEFQSGFGLNWQLRQPAVANGSANPSDPARLVEALRVALYALRELGLSRKIWTAVEETGQQFDPELRNLILEGHRVLVSLYGHVADGIGD